MNANKHSSATGSSRRNRHGLSGRSRFCPAAGDPVLLPRGAGEAGRAGAGNAGPAVPCRE
jgi:hypothetical protein